MTSGERERTRGDTHPLRLVAFATLVIALVAVAVVGASTAIEETAVSDVEFAGGDGTADDPYQIETVEQLQAIEDDLDAHYELVDDIDASDADFEPIGSFDEPFTGEFDGNGYRIQNMSISAGNAGLFAATDDSLISGVAIENADVNAELSAGTLVGTNAGTVEGVLVIDSEVNGDTAGGIVGQNSGTVQNSFTVNTTVSGLQGAGGIAGYHHQNGTIHRTITAHATVEGLKSGGIVGHSDDNGTITQSISRGNDLSKPDGTEGGYVGGIVGVQENSSHIETSYAISAVETPENDVGTGGGLTGQIQDNATIDESYSAGSVTGTEEDYLGGVVGIAGDAVEITDVYWDQEVTDQLTGIGEIDDTVNVDLTGLETNRMTGQDAPDNMDGLNFDETWETTELYPTLAFGTHTLTEVEIDDDGPGEQTTYTVDLWLDEPVEAPFIELDLSDASRDGLDLSSVDQDHVTVNEDDGSDLDVLDLQLEDTAGDGNDDTLLVEVELDDDELLETSEGNGPYEIAVDDIVNPELGQYSLSLTVFTEEDDDPDQIAFETSGTFSIGDPLDDDVETFPVVNVDRQQGYETVTEALDDANSGEVIELDAGTTFEEAVTVDTENVTITTDPDDPATIRYAPTDPTGTSTIDVLAPEVTLQNVGVERIAAENRDQNESHAQGIAVRNDDVTVENVVVEGNLSEAADDNEYDRFDGIVVIDGTDDKLVRTSGVEIVDSEISGFHSGIVLSSWYSDDDTENTGGLDDITLDGNDLAENENGLVLKRHFDRDSIGLVTVTDNRIENNSARGVYFVGDGDNYQGYDDTHDGYDDVSNADVALSDGEIADNGKGLVHNGSTTITATENWWGSRDGPGGVGVGQGDTVEGTGSSNVEYTPWLDAPLEFDPNTRGAANVDGVPYPTVQEAVIEAGSSEDSDHVDVLAGTYDEDVVDVETNVTITRAPNADRPTIRGTIEIIGDDVIVRGLAVEPSGDDDQSSLLRIDGADDVTVGSTRFEGTDTTQIESVISTIGSGDGSQILSNEIRGFSIAEAVRVSDHSNVTVADNRIVDTRAGVTTTNGVSDVVIEDNEIDVSNEGVGPAGDSHSIEIVGNDIVVGEFDHEDAADQVGVRVRNEGTTIRENVIESTNTSVWMDLDDESADSDAFVTRHNDLLGDEFGLDASGFTGTVNATENWWGHPSGPGGDGVDEATGVGSNVTANVEFDPWLDDEFTLGNPIEPAIGIDADTRYGSENVTVDWRTRDLYEVEELEYELRFADNESEVESGVVGAFEPFSATDPDAFERVQGDELAFSELADGEYELIVADGDDTIEVSKTFSVNTDAPDLDVSRDRPGEPVSEQVSLEVTVEADDEAGQGDTATVEILDDTDEVIFETDVSEAFDDPVTTTWDTADADEDGEYTLRVTAADVDDNVAESTRSVVVDNSPPEIRSIDPGEGEELFTNDTIEVDVRASDELSDVESVTVTLSATFTSFTASNTTAATDGRATASFDAGDLVGDGEYEVFVTATDDVGNELSLSDAATGGIVEVDTTAPDIGLSTSDVGTEAATLTLTADEPLDAGTVEAELVAAPDDLEGSIDLTDPVGDGERFVAEFDASEAGTYEIEAAASDLAGNPATASRTANVTQFDIVDGIAEIDPAGIATELNLSTTLDDGDRQAALSGSNATPSDAVLSPGTFGGQYVTVDDAGVDAGELENADIIQPVDGVMADLPDGFDPEEVNLSRFNETTGEFSGEEIETELVEIDGEEFFVGSVDGFSTFGTLVVDEQSPVFEEISGETELDSDQDETTLTFEYDDLDRTPIDVSAVDIDVDPNPPVPDEQITEESAEVTLGLEPGEERDVEVEIADEAGNIQTEEVTVTRAEDLSDVGDGDDDSPAIGGGGGGPTASGPTIDITPDGVDPDDGFVGPTTVDLQNLEPGQPTAVDFLETRRALDVPNREIDLDRIDVTAAQAIDVTMDVHTGETPPTDSAREFDSPRGSPLGYVQIDHDLDDDQIDSVEIDFRIDKERLEGEDPREVALYRLEGEDGEIADEVPADADDWRELPTEVVDETDTHFVFTAESPGLSEFAAAVKQPEFEIDDALVSVQEITSGDSVQVEVIVTNIGGADGTYTVELWVEDELVEEEDLTIAADATRQTIFDREFVEPGSYEVRVNDVSTGEIEVEPPESDEPDGTDAEESDGLPGFGASVTLIAILIAAAIATRRR